jgi:hypothetical protein
MIVRNSVFWGNVSSAGTPDFYYSAMAGPSLNLSVTYNYTQTAQTGTGNITGTGNPFADDSNPAGADGIFGTNDDGLQLAPASGAINKGTPDTTGFNLPAFDLAGNMRINGSAIDMGAYEYQNGVLAVSIQNFTGKLTNSVAQLQWKTGEESDYSRFEVEKSTDNTTFVSIGSFAVKGNNSSYSTTASQPEAVAYYRLHIIDKDGRSSFSKIIALSQNASENVLLSLFPVPAKDHINLRTNKTGILKLSDIKGNTVFTKAIEAGVTNLDISRLPAGTYICLLNGVTVKFIVQ